MMKRNRVKLAKEIERYVAFTSLYVSDYKETDKLITFKIGLTSLHTEIKLRFACFDEDLKKMHESIKESYPIVNKIKK